MVAAESANTSTSISSEGGARLGAPVSAPATPQTVAEPTKLAADTRSCSPFVRIIIIFLFFHHYYIYNYFFEWKFNWFFGADEAKFRSFVDVFGYAASGAERGRQADSPLHESRGENKGAHRRYCSYITSRSTMAIFRYLRETRTIRYRMCNVHTRTHIYVCSVQTAEKKNENYLVFFPFYTSWYLILLIEHYTSRAEPDSWHHVE